MDVGLSLSSSVKPEETFPLLRELAFVEFAPECRSTIVGSVCKLSRRGFGVLGITGGRPMELVPVENNEGDSGGARLTLPRLEEPVGVKPIVV
jgi:hypothetical protein